LQSPQASLLVRTLPLIHLLTFDRLVSRIALYPDPLLAQVLAAATYPDQIPDAAQWADEHHYLRGDDLARAITEDNLPWDPSVQALLPFPSVLEMMASDINWTRDLGNAFLAQQQDVMDAVQRMRRQAVNYGYLRTNPQVVVSTGPYITIVPANPDFIVVPVYNPAIVFARPAPGFFVGGAINFGFGISLGVAFHPWGWGATRFVWDRHEVFVANRRWERNWVNRNAYVHHYDEIHRSNEVRRVERHDLIRRDENERNAARLGHERPYETHHEQHAQRGDHGREH
jgi:hypothetical protein